MKNLTLFAQSIIPSLIACCFIAGCGNPKGGGKTQERDERVVLIFKDAPAQHSKVSLLAGTLNMGYPDHIVGFVDTNKLVSYYVPRSIGYDTLAVPVHNGVAEVSHAYLVSETIHYLFEAGDTVLFTYDSKKRPVPSSLSGEEKTELYNFRSSFPGYLNPNHYSNLSVLSDHIYTRFFQVINGMGPTADKNPESIMKKARDNYIDLDSLQLVYENYLHDLENELRERHKNGTIPEQWYNYYLMRIDADRLQSESAAARRHYKKQEPLDPENFYSFLDDSLVGLITYQNMVKYYMSPRIINADDPSIEDEHGFIFDSVADDSRIPPYTKKAILNRYLNNIIFAADGDRAAEYRDKYVSITGDTLQNNPSVNKSNLIDKYSNDLNLTSLSGEKLSYDRMLELHRGKVIYIDLWASWCGPCIAGMPAAKVLREEYRDKDVAFVYLAYNDKPDAWKKSVKKHETDYLGHNYFIENSRENEFLKEVKLYGIPFMLIYDKEGNLAVINAPRPESDDIRSALNKYL